MYRSLGKSAFQTAVNTGMSLAIDDMVHDRNVQDAKNAEVRAQKYWKDRFDIINDYNSPEAVMERYRQAGLNPASAFEGGAVGQALDPSVNPNNPNSTRGPQASPLDLLGAEQSLANIDLTRAQQKKIEAETHSINSGLAYQQLQINALSLLNEFNAEQYPKMLKELDERIRLYHEQGDYYSQGAIQLSASAMLLTFQSARQQFGLNLDMVQYDLLVQKLETGEFQKDYWQWHAKHEEALTKLASIEGGIKQATFEQVYESGLFGKLSEQELKNKKAEWNKMQADLQKMYNLGFYPQGVDSKGLATGEASPYRGKLGEFTTPRESLWYYLATELI